jgi:hypothetical protein
MPENRRAALSGGERNSVGVIAGFSAVKKFYLIVEKKCAISKLLHIFAVSINLSIWRRIAGKRLCAACLGTAGTVELKIKN